MSLLAELGGGSGALKGLGIGLLPISIAVLLLRRPAGPVRKLLKAGALSPGTARRSNSVGIPREDVLRPYRRLRVVHRLDDGRWYVDERRERTVRYALWCLIAIFALSLATLVWFTSDLSGSNGGELP